MPVNFTNRSRAKELLDMPAVPTSSLFQNLKELNIINRLLGGHRTTLSGIRKLITDKNKTYRILDVGCGGGDTLLSIAHWAKKNNYKVQLTGIDIMPEAIDYAREACSVIGNTRFFISDYRKMNFKPGEYDIVVTSLFCHHLYDDDLDTFLEKFSNAASLGVIINDLHRHPLAYYSIKYLTKIFSGSHMVKNDAPLSVSKGFKRKELAGVIQKMNIGSFKIQWFWAFRYMVLINTKVSS